MVTSNSADTNQTQTFKHYSAYYKSGIHGHGGVCILVQNKFIHSQVQFQADSQTIAVCVTINNITYTVASVYVPPSEAIKPHIKYLKAWCQKSLNILKILSHTEWGADQTTLLKLYRSLVRSKLYYGCLVYGSASKTALAKLDPVHNQGPRLSLGAFRSSPVESLYVEAHEPPLEIRREKLALQYILKLKANPGNPAHDVVFNPTYQILYADKESATDSFGIHCKKLLKKAKIDVG